MAGGDEVQRCMRATLLEADPETTAWLEAAYSLVPIPLSVVHTVEALQRAAERAGPNDFLIVDCSLSRPEDIERCRQVVRRTAVEVHVVYARAALLNELRPIARCPLTGLSIRISWRDLLALLREIHVRALSVETPSAILRMIGCIAMLAGQPLDRVRLRQLMAHWFRTIGLRCCLLVLSVGLCAGIGFYDLGQQGAGPLVITTFGLNQLPSTIVADEHAGRMFVGTSRIGGVDGRVYAFDTVRGKTLFVSHTLGRPAELIVDSTAKVVLADLDLAGVLGAGAGPGRIAVLDERTGAPRQAITVPPGSPGAAMTPESSIVVLRTQSICERRLTCATLRQATYLLDPESGQLAQATPHSRTPIGTSTPRFIYLDRTRRRAFVFGDRVLYLYDRHSGALLQERPLASIPTAITMDTTSGNLFVASWGTTASSTSIQRVRLNGGAGQGFASVAVTGPTPMGIGSVDVIDGRTGAVLRTLPAGIGPVAIALDTRKGYLFVLNWGSAGTLMTGAGQCVVSIVDVRGGKLLRTLHLSGAPSGIVVDSRRSRVFIVTRSAQTMARESQWCRAVRVLPTWLRSVLDFLPGCTPPVVSTWSGAVTVLDSSRV